MQFKAQPCATTARNMLHNFAKVVTRCAVQELQRGLDYRGTMQLLVQHRQHALAETWAATRPRSEQACLLT